MSDNIVIIKKYANRRLYNTETSMYVTLEDLAQMVRDGREFEVVDAKTGTDITHQVLTQIIFEAETRGHNDPLLPINFLRQLIRFYDNSLQSVVPQYLEMMMDSFSSNQEKLRENAEKMFGGFQAFSGMSSFEELHKRNMDLFQKSMEVFNPFAGAHAKDAKDREIEALKKELEALKKELRK